MRILCVFLLALASVAKPPVLDALWPAGGQRGSDIEVLAVGKQESWPVLVWCDHPQLRIEALADKGKLRVVIPDNATPGPCLIRLHNAEGASPLCSFVIGESAEIAEVEPNNALRTPQTVELPIVVNGRLGKSGDSDFYAIELAAGARLVARVEGYSLGSPIDPFLHLHAPDGAEIAFASDSHNRDPILVHQVPTAGRYVLQVVAIDHKASTNVRFAGSEKAVYRLHLEVSDWQRYPKPTGETVGRLEAPGAQAEHLIPAKKGEKFLIQVEAASLRLPLDAVLLVNRPGGKLLKEIDDSNKKADAEYLLTAAEDGDYQAVIRDRFGRGGEDFWYRFSAHPPKPVCEVRTSSDQITLKAGETTDLKLTVTRLHGHDAAVSVVAERLPAGVSLEVPEVPKKTGDLTLKLIADAQASTASAELRLTLVEADSPRPIPYSFQNDESRGNFLLNEARSLWITVLPKAEK
jgi:hypothetical protein